MAAILSRGRWINVPVCCDCLVCSVSWIWCDQQDKVAYELSICQLHGLWLPQLMACRLVQLLIITWCQITQYYIQCVQDKDMTLTTLHTHKSVGTPYLFLESQLALNSWIFHYDLGALSTVLLLNKIVALNIPLLLEALKAHFLTHLFMDKMAAIHTQYFQMHFHEWKMLYFD